MAEESQKIKKHNPLVKVLTVIIITVIVAIGIGIYLYFKPQSLVTFRRPDLFLSSIQLYHSFDENADSAVKAYDGKIIQVSGHVNTVGRDEYGNVNISLSTGASSKVTGEFASQTAESVAYIIPGDSVSFKGTVMRQQGMMGIPGDIIVKHARLVKDNK